MDGNQARDISEKELAGLLESMLENVLVTVIFGEEERDGDKGQF